MIYDYMITSTYFKHSTSFGFLWISSLSSWIISQLAGCPDGALYYATRMLTAGEERLVSP